MINNGTRARLVIDGIFDGTVGVQGNQVAFVPPVAIKRPGVPLGALLDGAPVLIRPRKDPNSMFWIATVERLT